MACRFECFVVVSVRSEIILYIAGLTARTTTCARYTPSFPSKFVQPNGDMWLSLSGHGHDPSARSPAYALHYAKVTFAGQADSAEHL
jgi:hypothetical protein